jgi:hypothetical protein
MSDRISAKSFSGASEDSRDSPDIPSGGILAGCSGECLTRIAPRMETFGTITDLAGHRGGETVDSASGLCEPEKPLLIQAFVETSD